MQHDAKPFHAIISVKSDAEHQLLDASEITEADPLWGVQRTVIVPREAQAMAANVRTLLSTAKHIIFIDPHFGPENARHRRPLKAFLEAAVRNRSIGTPAVEVHTQAKSTEEFFRDECCNKLPAIIPNGLTVRFVRWTARQGGQPLHNRYILTDIGGLSFLHGLDDGQAGETDDVTLLDDNSYKQRWTEFLGEHPAFDLSGHPFEVLGKNMSEAKAG